MKYSLQLQNYFHHRRHGGSLDAAKPHVYVAKAGKVNFEVLVLSVEYLGHIVQAKFQASGSIALISGGEFICEWLEQKTLPELRQLTPEIILKSLGLGTVHLHVANLLMMAVNELSDHIVSRQLGA